jgi:transposase
MKSRDGGIVGYNVQTAVDAKHHLIVAHEVITEGIDRDQLVPMAEQARSAMGIEALTVVADRGYFKGEQVLQCDQAGITPIVPKTLTSNSLAFPTERRILISSFSGRGTARARSA